MYRPFFVLLWIGMINDTFAAILSHTTGNNIANSNIYVLVEFALLLLLFYRWNDSVRKRKYWLLLGVGLAVWILDNFILHSLTRSINSLFRIYYCLIILFMSIDMINRLIVFERKMLIRNARFLISVGFVCYFSFKAFIESFYIFELPFSKAFYANIFFIMSCINVFCNLVYTLAILWIPKRQEFSIPS